MTLQILRTNDLEWDDLFDRLPVNRRDVFYSRAFADVCQQTVNSGDEVCCAAMRTRQGAILYPFVRRNVGRLTGRSDYSDFSDIVGLYGRGGLVADESGMEQIPSFHSALAEYFHEQAVIGGFDRFHPVIGNDAWVSTRTRVMETGGFVVVDMRPEMPVIMESFKASVRKDLRKAERNGVVCFAEASCGHLRDFLEIYRLTMTRNEATDFYYFSEEYFAAIGTHLSGQFHFFYAMADGQIVSCELVLHHGKYCHSFLGGTRSEALRLCVNPLLKVEIIRVLKARGCEHFLLGGGASPDDGIFAFKKAFAPQGVLPSRVGGTLWDPQAYDRLRETIGANGESITSTRFQFYDAT